KSANPLALIAAAQPCSDTYYQAPKPLPEGTSSTGQPLEQVQNHNESNVYDNVRRHSEQQNDFKAIKESKRIIDSRIGKVQN
ncbi:hypothetical protein Tco_0384583, partial [Tanacetum coccineum]